MVQTGHQAIICKFEEGDCCCTWMPHITACISCHRFAAHQRILLSLSCFSPTCFGVLAETSFLVAVSRPLHAPLHWMLQQESCHRQHLARCLCGSPESHRLHHSLLLCQRPQEDLLAAHVDQFPQRGALCQDAGCSAQGDKFSFLCVDATPVYPGMIILESTASDCS